MEDDAAAVEMRVKATGRVWPLGHVHEGHALFGYQARHNDKET
jgi:hypothetical protein